MPSVLLVVSVRAFRDGLEALLNAHSEGCVVATAWSMSDAADKVLASGAQVAAIDITVPDALSRVSGLQQASPGLKVVALGVPEGPRLIECAEAGFVGLVTPGAPVESVAAALEGAVRGEAPCSPAVAATLLQHVAALATRRENDVPPPRLTSRESAILLLLEQGLSNKEIGARLYIEVSTVKKHVHSILEKLQVRSRAEAAAWVRRAPPSDVAYVVGR